MGFVKTQSLRTVQFDKETFGTKYALTIMTFGTKLKKSEKNFGVKFAPKEVIHFGKIIVPNVYKCFIFFKKLGQTQF